MSDLLGLTVAVRPKTPTVYTIYSVNKITGELEEKDTSGERNGIRTGILTSMQHNFSGEQEIDSTTLSNRRTPSGQHGSGTAGFLTNSGTHGFSTNSTTGGRIGIRAGISSIDEFGSVYHMYLRSALRSTPIGYVQMSALLGLTAAVSPKTPIVYTIYSVNQITGELEEKDTSGERNGIRTGILTSMQHNFSGE